MKLQTANFNGYQMEQLTRDTQTLYSTMNANFSSIEGEFNMLNVRQTQMEREIMPFVKWMREVYPEMFSEFRTAQLVAQRMDYAGEEGCMQEAP